MRRQQLLIWTAWLVYVAAWFLPVVTEGVTLPDGLPGVASLSRSRKRGVAASGRRVFLPRLTSRGQKGEGEVILDKIQQLSPKDDNQRAVKAQATNLATQIGQTRC